VRRWIGSRLESALEAFGSYARLAGAAFVGLLTPRWELRAWIRQAEQIGVRSFGVAAITTLFTGMVLALQSAYSLPQLGIKYYIGTMVSKSLTRELGPVLVALVVGGRIGAGMAAELGTMKVTEQIDALRSMAADPIRKLVVPKLAATLVMIPALTAIGNALGIFGGMAVGWVELDLSPAFYWNDVLSSLTLQDLGSGIGKSFFFAFLIATIACWYGLGARGGADGVGRATTSTVVSSAIAVLVADYVLTKLFHVL
jgi:phospholipid/cholesterol/gamma-HCH transport system permease protein